MLEPRPLQKNAQRSKSSYLNQQLKKKPKFKLSYKLGEILFTLAQQASAADKQKLQKLNLIRSKISAFKSHIARFSSEIDNTLAEADIPKTERTVFYPIFPGDTELPLVRRETQLNKNIMNRLGAVDEPNEGTIRWLQKRIEELQKRESADKARQEKTKNIQSRISKIGTDLERIRKEIAQIEGPERKRIAVAHQERMRSYVAYFENLVREQQTLEELYAPVSDRLTGESATTQERALEFSIRWEADLENWLERGKRSVRSAKGHPISHLRRSLLKLQLAY